jgi:hypothetical protein
MRLGMSEMTSKPESKNWRKNSMNANDKKVLRVKILSCSTKLPSGCILWTAGCRVRKQIGNYGSIYVPSEKRSRLAHRVAYQIFKGAIPKSRILDHKCNQTMCINVEHLRPVTPKENVLRGKSPSAVNSRKTHCPKGHPYSGENLMVKQYANSLPVRVCRACQKIHIRQQVVRISDKRRLAKQALAQTEGTKENQA